MAMPFRLGCVSLEKIRAIATLKFDWAYLFEYGSTVFKTIFGPKETGEGKPLIVQADHQLILTL